MDFYDEEMERMKRDKNFYEMKAKMEQLKYDKLKVEYDYLKRREATLTAFEKSLPQRIKVYKSKKAPQVIIDELTLLSNMLAEEKERLLDESNQNGEEKNEN